MRILKVNPNSLRESEGAINEAVEVIKNGGVVVYPTDTVYGLGVDATNEEAVEKLFIVKKRPETKPLPIIIDSIQMAKNLALIDARQEKILLKIWPGAVTVLFNQIYKLPGVVTAGKKTIALRIPNYKLAYYLLQKLGRPLTATSANISGHSPSTKIRDVLRQFENEHYQPDLVLDAGDLVNTEPSTILDLSSGEPKITRIGPVSPEQLANILNI